MATEGSPRPHPRVALVHAVLPAIAPIHAAFRAGWPEAEAIDILDAALSPDRARDEGLTAAMSARIEALADYAVLTGADAVLFTCSAFGPAIEAAARRLALPVLKPNEAMFEEALGRGARLGMLATFAPSVASMEAEFAEERARAGGDATLETLLVPGALDALKAGDAATHDGLLAEAAPRLADCDAILLAHFSTSRAAPAIRAALDRPILTSPDAAVAKVRRLLGAAVPADA
jgi:Asp/Glu/hydantoin racemase